MAMVGSVITKEMLENHIYGGSPEVDLTLKIGNLYFERSIEEKIAMMNSKVEEFASFNGEDTYKMIKVVKSFPQNRISSTSYFNVQQELIQNSIRQLKLNL